MAQSQETSFSFDFASPIQPTIISYQGDAHFIPNVPYLQLTATNANGNAVGNSAGRVLYTTPVLFKDAAGAQASFETTINFTISVNPGHAPPGDGLAFFIAPVGSTIPLGSYGGNLGIFGSDGTSPNLFAVEFDTAFNEWDPSFDHVGIDLGSRISRSLVSIPEGLVLKEVKATINYNAATKTITVTVDTGSKTTITALNHDLGSLLNDEVQVGISAATGAYASRHEIKTWSFRSASAAANI